MQLFRERAGTEWKADRSGCMRQTQAMTLLRDCWLLTTEASMVIAMRMAMFAVWDAKAQKEADLMVAEKIGAALELQFRALTGGLGTTPYAAMTRSVALYRRAVTANRKRLSRRTAS